MLFEYKRWFFKNNSRRNLLNHKSTKIVSVLELITMTSYTPVQYIFREVIEEEIAKQTEGKIFYFDENDVFESTAGRIVKVEEISHEGTFIFLEPDKRIRIDRIITLFGKPGAAFDEYDAYANQCLSCTGGYEL
jgi:hypothetical protein